jgi:hypothetical protein
MKKFIFLIIPLTLLVFFSTCAKSEQEDVLDESSLSSSPAQKIELWNGRNMSDWVLFLEDPKVDVNSVWSVNDGIIACSGIPRGYMRTKNKWTDYKLHAEWRWAEEAGNSGVLLHCQLPDTLWPLCIEAQLQAGNAGDFIMMGGATVNEQETPERRRINKGEESSEKEPGEWNSYDIICQGDKIEVYVNGIQQNACSGASISSGFIGFQSEGKPIEFRNLYVEPVD